MPFFLILIIIAAAGSYLYTKSNNVSKAILQASQNRFTLKFQIKEKDRKNAEAFLEKANLPANLMEGITFEVDATSSAVLAFALPSQADLTLGTKNIGFTGKYQGLRLNTFQFDEVKMPASTTLAIAGSALPNFLKTHYKLPGSFLTFLSDPKKPLYFFVFNQNADWVMMFKNDPTKTLLPQSLGLSEESFKEEEFDDQLKLSLIRAKDINDEEVTLAYFSLDNWSYLSSSRDSAKTIIKIQRNQLEADTFKLRKTNPDTAFAITFNNEEQLGDNFFNLIFSEKPAFSENLKKVKHLEFALRKDSFSGLIELK